MTALYTAYEYDEKDRQIKTTLPDGSIQFTEFEIKDGMQMKVMNIHLIITNLNMKTER